jgi:hypothetical protein
MNGEIVIEMKMMEKNCRDYIDTIADSRLQLQLNEAHSPTALLHNLK